MSIKTHLTHRLLTITIDRPEKANALSQAMLAGLERVLDDAHADTLRSEPIQVIVLTGTGDRVFSAGYDLSELAEKNGSLEKARQFDQMWDRITGKLANFPGLTVAALNGVCAGGGLSFSIACDLRIAVDHCQLFYPVLKNQVLPSPTDVVRLNQLIGPARTKAVLMGGVRLTADEALAWGLVDAVTPVDQLEEVVERFTAAALNAESHEVWAMKRLCDAPEDRELVEVCYRAIYGQENLAKEALRTG